MGRPSVSSDPRICSILLAANFEPSLRRYLSTTLERNRLYSRLLPATRLFSSRVAPVMGLSTMYS